MPKRTMRSLLAAAALTGALAACGGEDDDADDAEESKSGESGDTDTAATGGGCPPGAPSVRLGWFAMMPPDDLAGVHGAGVRLVRRGDLGAVVSPVDAEEFEESSLATRLEDLSWLENLARSHNGVIDWLAQGAMVLPLRLLTVYRSEERIDDVLAVNESEFSEALDRLAGRVEWGVKVFAVEAEAVEPSAEPPADESANPGRSYLRRKQAARQSQEQGWSHAAQFAAEIDGALSELAESRSQYRPQSAELSGTTEQNVLNVAYLVPSEDRERFVALVRELQVTRPRCRVELTGPWAPYSFGLAGTPSPGREAESADRT